MEVAKEKGKAKKRFTPYRPYQPYPCTDKGEKRKDSSIDI
jgi:hypothetical protein